jgi:methyltransferase
VVTQVAFTVLIAIVSVERLLELRLSRRNEAALRERGGVEHGASHYPAMVALHAGLLLGSVAEVWLLSRSFVAPLGFSMLGLVLIAGAGRFWVIATLRSRWTTRVVVVPDLPRITGGPYRFFDHPNYIVVVVEGFALPMVHTAWITAILFTIGNAILLTRRIRIEDAALKETLNP